MASEKPRCPICKREISGRIDRNCGATFDETLGGDTIEAQDCKRETLTLNVRDVLQLRAALKEALEIADLCNGSANGYDDTREKRLAEMRKLLP